MVTMLLNTELDFYVIDLQISKSRSLCQKLDVCNNEAIHNKTQILRSLLGLYAIFLVKYVIKTYITAIQLLPCVNESSTCGK